MLEQGEKRRSRPPRKAHEAGRAPTRDRLLAGAREAFAELGYAGTRVEDVVTRAGTSHGTFYTYFADKHGVLLALTEQTARELYGSAASPVLDPPPRTPRDVIRARTAAFMDTYARDWDVVRTWIQASGVHPEVEQLRARIRTAISKVLAAWLADDQERGLIRREVDVEVAVVALVAMSEEFSNRWLSEGRALGDREVDQVTDLWVHAVYEQHALER